MKNKIVTATFGICLALFIISFSIAAPILFRPFYYLQINHIMDLGKGYFWWKPEWTFDEIMRGYNEVLNFCTLPWVTKFSAGIFNFSADGASHFADCKVLFMIDFAVLFLTCIGLVVITILKRKKIIDFTRFLHRRVYFWVGASILFIIVLVFVLILIVGFDNAFTTFHAMFFPGKGNWIFDYEVDEIINVMPEEFFMNCAILIGSLIGIQCVGGIVCDFIPFNRKNK